MSREKKVLTENPIIDELIYNGQLLMYGCILKDQDEADKYETFESIKQSDFYMLVKENRVTFGSFNYTEEMISQVGSFDSNTLKEYAYENNKIPQQLRPALLEIAKEDFVNNYEELNDYYRMLNGQPSINDPGIVITMDDLDGRNGYIWKSVQSQRHLKLHEWEDAYILLLEEKGYLDKIRAEHPDLKYLNFLGNKKINIYTARKAQRFECLYLPDCKSTDVQTHFFQLLEANRIAFLRTLYTEAYRFNSDYYDKFMIIMIILQSFCDLISEYSYYIIRRDIFDIRTIRYLFEANGVKFFEEVPMKYQLTLVRNLNRLIKYKSTDRNIIDICSLFGFKSIALFKYYILKDRKDNIEGTDFSYIKTVSEKWTDCVMPKEKISSIAFGNDKYVVALPNTSYVYVSYDLKTWRRYDIIAKTIDDDGKTVNQPVIENWKKIIFANGFYVILADNYIAYSRDAKTWKVVQLQSFHRMPYVDIIYAQGIYVAISPWDVVYSSDLNKWISCKLGVDRVITGIVKFPRENINDHPYSTDEYGNIVYTKFTYVNNGDGTYTETIKTTYDMYMPVMQLLYDGERFLALCKYGIYTSDYGTKEWAFNGFKETMDFLSIKNSVLEKPVIPEGDNTNIMTFANGIYYFIHTSYIYYSSDLVTWRRKSVDGDNATCTSIKFANNRFIVLKSSGKRVYKSRDLETWTSFDLDITANYKPLGYGNMKFVVLPSEGESKGYYFECNSAFTETSDDEDDSIVNYNTDENYTLKFIKVPLQGNVHDALSDGTNIHDYYSIVDQDKYWEGDKDRETVKNAILEHEFNMLRTKYYSIENIVDFSEISFQLSYFMNIIMNYDLTDQLRVPLPFIPGSTVGYPLIDVFVFLYALGYRYLGTRDDILSAPSGVLTIRSFNFETDLNKLADTLYDKHHDKMYDLTEICGGLTFQSPKTPILTYKELLAIYTNNKEIYSYITNQMIHCKEKELYDIYKKVYDALFIAKLNMENFSVLDSDGNIIYTYATFTDYLKEKQFPMYSFLQEIDSITKPSEKRLRISDVMNDVVSYVEEYTPIMDEGNLDYIWHGLPTLDMDFVKYYITLVIKFFKSFKAELLNVSTLYKMCDKFDNLIGIVDTMHFDYRFDWALIWNIYEDIEMDVTMTETERVRARDFMFKVITYAAKQMSLREDFSLEDILLLLSVTFKLEDDVYIDEDGNRIIVEKIKDKYSLQMSMTKNEDIYWFEKLFRKYLTTKTDIVLINSQIEIKSIWIDEDTHEVTFSDPAYYTDK